MASAGLGSAQLAGEAQTIRAQAKKSTTDQGQSRDIVKAVLASPLTTPWPNIPRHLQAAVVQSLPQLVPDEIAEYHVSRARCHRKEKRVGRRGVKEATTGDAEGATIGVNEGVEVDSEGCQLSAAASVAAQAPVAATRPTTRPEASSHPRPAKPISLDHLVLGINETIKTLERSIDDLKLRLMLIADALNAAHGPNLPKKPIVAGNSLLPTAPRDTEPNPSDKPASEVGSTNRDPPLLFILIPLLSISPVSLVSPIPQYCATHNSLVWQWTQLSKIARARLKAEQHGVIGKEREEVRVVPLGNVEAEMAAAVGLRRLACLGIRRSHPQATLLHSLLPKSVLHPPRHALTLPYPTSELKVHSGDSEKNTQIGSAPSSVPIPHVHYAPLHIKGITTSQPVNGGLKRQARMEAVRKRRAEVKARKVLEREGKKTVKQKGKGKGKDKGKTHGKEGGKGKIPGEGSQTVRDAAKAKSQSKA